MAKPDNRADNVEKLQDHVQNTIENMDEAEEYLAENADNITAQERRSIEENNENREFSIRGFREEIQDEVSDRGI